jgi:hypothetical protein
VDVNLHCDCMYKPGNHVGYVCWNKTEYRVLGNEEAQALVAAHKCKGRARGFR